MNRSTFLYIASGLTFLTGLNHLIGTLIPVPADQEVVIATIETMKNTMVPMPIGDSRSYMQILDGNNFGTILFLLLCSAQLLVIAKSSATATIKGVLIITTIGLVGFSIVSLRYFFPVPVIFTGLAALLCVIAYKKTNDKSS